MSRPYDGGPAFPCADRGDGFSDGGMSLRDWFAGQAISGIEADSAYDWTESGVAGRAYRIADAMLAERLKGATTDAVLVGRAALDELAVEVDDYEITRAEGEVAK